MAKLLFCLLLCTIAFSCNQETNKSKEDNKSVQSESSAAFSGTFFGVTPCADCPGIETTINFNRDSTFIESLKYLERNSSFADTGKWSLRDTVITVTLQGGGALRYYLLQNDSTIAVLDADKNRISGPMADFFILKKKK